MQLLKKIIIRALFALGLLLMVVMSNNNSASSAGGRFSLIKASSTAPGFATTTQKFLDPGTSKSTSTLQFASANTDQVGLNIQYNASSTNSTLQYTIEHSDDEVDWFCEAGTPATATGSTTITTFGARCPIYQWTPGKSGISRRGITVTELGTRFMRVRFGSKDGNGALYAEAILRQPN